MLRGTAQNPDTFFQAREASNPFYLACVEHVERGMERFFSLTGRRYRLFEYVGHPEAERVVVMMGSGAETMQVTVEELVARGERVGLVKVRLYRPFSAERLLAALPKSVRRLAVLDRTKEPGAVAEPLHCDVTTVLAEDWEGTPPLVIGGRYGLSSKEFTPAMAKAVLDELAHEKPKRRFTIGIVDDVTELSLTWDPGFRLEPPGVRQAVFWGLGSDGTVGANKSSIKIIGEDPERHVQAYFVYDSKKSGAVPVSHLGSVTPDPGADLSIRRLVGCHQSTLERTSPARSGRAILLEAGGGPCVRLRARATHSEGCVP